MLNIYLSQILNLLSGENLSSTNTINSLVVSIATDNDFIVEQIERLISNSSLLIKVRSSSDKYGIMPDWSNPDISDVFVCQLLLRQYQPQFTIQPSTTYYPIKATRSFTEVGSRVGCVGANENIRTV